MCIDLAAGFEVGPVGSSFSGNLHPTPCIEWMQGNRGDPGCMAKAYVHSSHKCSLIAHRFRLSHPLMHSIHSFLDLSPSRSLNRSLYIYLYSHIYIHIFIYTGHPVRHCMSVQLSRCMNIYHQHNVCDPRRRLASSLSLERQCSRTRPLACPASVHVADGS